MERIVRTRKREYAIISKSFLQDSKLSLKAKGLLAVVMSLSERLEFDLSAFRYMAKDGRSSVRSAIEELIDNGYCKIVCEKDENGEVIDTQYYFVEDLKVSFEDGTKVEVPTEKKEEAPKKKEKKKKEKAPCTTTEYDEIASYWNEVCSKNQSIKMLNTKRKNKIRTLLENNNASIEDLKTAINIISISSFCCGKNDRGWKATFDWLINDTNSCFSRLLEGSFLSNNEERKEYSRIIGRSSSSASSGKPDNITLSDEEYEMYLSCGYTFDDRGRMFNPNGDLVQ